MESYGATCIYVVDSAGAMTMVDIREWVQAMKDVLNSDTELGIHAHHNLSLGVANSIASWTRSDSPSMDLRMSTGSRQRYTDIDNSGRIMWPPPH